MARSFVRGALVSAAIAALYLAAAPAQAASTTWNTTSNLNPTEASPNQPTTCPTQTAAGSGTTMCLSTPTGVGVSTPQGGAGQPVNGSDPAVIYGNQFTFTAGGNALQVGAFYLANNSTTSSTNTFSKANLESYSPGLGVTSVVSGSNAENVGSSPGHTMDNQGGFDAILFKFPSANYVVTSLTLSLFGGGNFDYYIGSASALASIQGLSGISLSSLTTANGWTNGGEVTTNVSCNSGGSGCVNNGSSTNNSITQLINAAAVQGQYLLVVAALQDTSDDIKIAAVGGTPGRVSEPSTLALLGTAGLIGFYLRRRKQAA